MINNNPIDILAVARAQLDAARTFRREATCEFDRRAGTRFMLAAYEDIEAVHFLAAELAREGNRVTP